VDHGREAEASRGARRKGVGGRKKGKK